ncbi:hypothetical protein J2X06_003165 [Lysobacter niastensis]|uniref:Uncharacterized protein n=1 Tax=Lysobacter niastensis TaxID=380629 RepID=A0ABU1WF00_9GAMM|nr:hypothetical protein [Lysobacter niastensis]MDR7135947.1 hypothetical protein [Lysobacter niastensis]
MSAVSWRWLSPQAAAPLGWQVSIPLAPPVHRAQVAPVGDAA